VSFSVRILSEKYEPSAKLEDVSELSLETPMKNGAMLPASLSAISPAVQEFAAAKGVSDYLNPVIGLAREAFPSSSLDISVGQDAEDETHQYIAIDVELGAKTAEELLVGQRVWSGGLAKVCPSRHAVHFVLGWR
jgi:hypothetical protein